MLGSPNPIEGASCLQCQGLPSALWGRITMADACPCNGFVASTTYGAGKVMQGNRGPTHCVCMCGQDLDAGARHGSILVMKPFCPGAAGGDMCVPGYTPRSGRHVQRELLGFAPVPRVHGGSPAPIAWHTLHRSPILPCQRQSKWRHHPLMHRIRSVGHGMAGSMRIDEILRGR